MLAESWLHKRSAVSVRGSSGNHDTRCVFGSHEEDHAHSCGFWDAARLLGRHGCFILVEPDLGMRIVWVPDGARASLCWRRSQEMAPVDANSWPGNGAVDRELRAQAAVRYARITSFVNPYLDPQGNGWNIIQSLTAIGSGGFYGKGFKASNTLNELGYLPTTIKHNDFIFSVLGEQHGFLGGILLIAALALLRLHRASTSRSRRKTALANCWPSGCGLDLYLHVSERRHDDLNHADHRPASSPDQLRRLVSYDDSFRPGDPSKRLDSSQKRSAEFSLAACQGRETSFLNRDLSINGSSISQSDRPLERSLSPAWSHLYAFDLRAERVELFVETLVAAVNVIDAIDFGGIFRLQPCENEGCGGAQIARHDRRAAQFSTPLMTAVDP